MPVATDEKSTKIINTIKAVLFAARPVADGGDGRMSTTIKHFTEHSEEMALNMPCAHIYVMDEMCSQDPTGIHVNAVYGINLIISDARPEKIQARLRNLAQDVRRVLFKDKDVRAHADIGTTWSIRYQQGYDTQKNQPVSAALLQMHFKYKEQR